jgi:PAS domain-containing protein
MVSIEHLETPAFLIDILADESFVYRYGNKPLFTRTALGQHLVIGRTPEDILPPPLASVVIAQYRDCVAKRAVMSFEEQFRLAGTTSHWRTTLVPILRPEGGAVAQILGLVVEITDSKRAELDVHRANAQLSLALQAVQGTHWEYDISRPRPRSRCCSAKPSPAR